MKLENNNNQVIITRPSPYGEELFALCEQNSISAKHLPLFKMVIGSELNQLQQHLNKLSIDDIVIIVSPQIIYAIKQHITSIHFPPYLNYFAIGKHTASLFHELTNQSIKHATTSENSEGLLTLLSQNKELLATRRNIIILCNPVGRKLLQQTLSIKHHVISLHCYQLVPISYQRETFITQGKKQLIIITSVNHLKQLDKYCSLDSKKTDHLIVSSARIYQHAKELGWVNITNAYSAKNQNLFKTITTLCHNTI